MAGNTAGPQVDEQKIRAQLKKWQERLLDLTKSNPLLALNRSRVSKLHVIRPEPRELFKTIVESESEIRLPMAVPRSQLMTREDGGQTQGYDVELGDIEFAASPLELLRKLRRIRDNARTSVEERGVTTLHLTFGALNWQDDWLGESTSPIWMVPVQLTSKGPNAPLRLTLANEEMQSNPALELYLRERHKVTLPELPEESTDDSLISYLEAVEHAVQDQHWSVSTEVWLSTFSFESLAIYHDLKAMADIAVKHPVVAGLARATVCQAGSDEISDSLDDLTSPEPVPIPILPADGSQLEALTYATTGEHLVIHGPPGTGKSQTISNLIADAIGRNKRVLFVSSKMAALNVVHRRLAEQGLTRFCLEAHSTKAGKAQIIDELRRTLEAEDSFDGGTFEETLTSLSRVRADLNRYVQEIHRVHEPLGKTLYQAIGNAARLAAIPEIRAPLPWPEVLTASRTDLLDTLDLLHELSAQAGIFDNQAAHPWRGFAKTVLTLTDQEQIEEDLRIVLAGIDRIEDLTPGIRWVVEEEDLSIDDLLQLQQVLISVAGLDRLPHRWSEGKPETLEQEATIFEMAENLQCEYDSQLAVCRQHFELALEQVERLLRPAVEKFSRPYQRILPSFWRWRGGVQRSAVARITHSTAVRLHAVACRLVEINSWFAAHEADLCTESPQIRDRASLSAASKRFRTGAALVMALHAINKQCSRRVELSDDFRHAALELPLILTEHFCHTVERIARHWPTGFVDGTGARLAAAGLLRVRVSELLGSLSLIQEWVTLQHTLQKCNEAELTPFVSALGSVSANHAPDVFSRRFYQLWISAVMAQSAVLVNFSGVQREQLAKKFGSLDASIRKLMALRIQSRAADSARRLRTAQTTVSGSEVGTLRRELQKRKKIKPLRRLFAEIPNALQALKPCMLMSPISVSTYLKPGSVTFDLVVFDEASQLPTPEGIAAILRARQVVVAGDRNQLPPTSFFRAQIELDEAAEDEDVTAEDPLESLLDEAVATAPLFRETYLKWHYRSKDERLIKFSNNFFYENRLVTFPSARTDGDGRGVRFVHVSDGVWDRGRSRTNRVEARRVAQLVIEHFKV